MKRERDTRSGTREDLFRYICENPGVSFPTIRNAFRMNDGTLRYHLDYLCGEDRIRRMGDGERRYYASDVPPSGPARIDGLTREERRVAMAIKEHPGISRSELRSLSGAGRGDLSYILRRLKERRFIWKVEDGGDPCYEYITERKLAMEMMSLILEKFLDDEIDRETFLALKKRIEEDLEKR
jgi:predicted transcriptional regulator